MKNMPWIVLAFIVNTLAIVTIVVTTNDATLGGRLGIVDALTGLDLLLAGGIVGAQAPIGRTGR